MRGIMFAVVAALFALIAEAGTIQPGRKDSEHIEYGSRFHSVARIRCREIESGAWQSASCVLVSERTALTAAHVVVGTDQWQVSTPSGEWVAATWVVMHPQFNREKPGSFDVAVVRLNDAIEIDYYPAIYEGDDEQGQVCSLAGYGITGSMVTGHTISDGIRRGGSNIVEEIEHGVLVCTAGGRPTQLEFCIAPGDSGGGLFLGRYLAGIHSFVSATGRLPKSRYGDESAHTRLSPPEMRSWISETASRK